MKSSYPYIKIGTILLFALYVYSCKHTNSISNDNDITFDTIRMTSNYHLDNDSTMPSCNLNLAFVYPKSFESESVLDTLQDLFISGFLDETYQHYAPLEALTKYKEAYIENYKRDIDIFYNERIASHEDNDKFLSYYETIKNEIKFNKVGILCFQVIQTNYKGGADSYQFLRNYVINLTTGKLIMEDDIFSSGYEKALTSIFKDYLLKDNNVKNISDLDNIGYFGVEEIISNGNFLIDDKAITYIFNKGEYSAYKLDPITISIPYSELSFVLKEDSPISMFVDK